MKTVIIMRTGSALCLDEQVEKSSALGEYRDTVGIINYLLSEGYRVVCFGRVKGKIDHPNMVVVDVNPTGIDPYSSKAETDAVYDEAVSRLRLAVGDDCPNYVLNPVGYRATMNYNNNPYGCIVQQVSIRYTAPALYAMEKMKLKRVILVTDIRNYTQEGETFFWPWTRPIAVLSQEDHSYQYKSRDHIVNVRAVYAGLENFWSFGFNPVKPGSVSKHHDVGVFAHTHLKDGRICKGRNEAWYKMYKACDYIHGHGWELFSEYEPERCLGLLKDARDMFFKLQQTECGPMISMRPSFNSCKLGIYAMNDCLPLPYGRGEPNTYDGAERYLPLHSELRVQSAYDIEQMVLKLKRDRSWRNDWVLKFQEATRPWWDKLRQCMNDIETADTDRQDWRMTYGGYDIIK